MWLKRWYWWQMKTSILKSWRKEILSPTLNIITEDFLHAMQHRLCTIGNATYYFWSHLRRKLDIRWKLILSKMNKIKLILSEMIDGQLKSKNEISKIQKFLSLLFDKGGKYPERYMQRYPERSKNCSKIGTTVKLLKFRWKLRFFFSIFLMNFRKKLCV